MQRLLVLSQPEPLEIMMPEQVTLRGFSRILCDALIYL